MKEIKEKFEFIDLDKRVIDKNQKRHKIDLSEYQKYLKGLVDDKAFADELVVRTKELEPS